MGKLSKLIGDEVKQIIGKNDDIMDSSAELGEIISKKYPNISISVSGDKKTGYRVNKIIVPKEDRNSGIGTAVMNDISNIADEKGAIVSLDPSADFGGSVERLKSFYKRFGFLENKGKNSDYSISEGMYRPPRRSGGNVISGAAPIGTGLASLLSTGGAQAMQSYDAPNSKLSNYISTIGSNPIDSNPLGLPQSKEDVSFNQAIIRPSNADGYARAPIHPLANKMAGAFDAYNRSIKGSPLEYVLPEAPTEWADKLAYDGKTRISDRLLAALGML